MLGRAEEQRNKKERDGGEQGAAEFGSAAEAGGKMGKGSKSGRATAAVWG